ncbi:MAG: hypothetical protein WDN50_01890 [Bradyrhizobium sp.]
MAGDRMTSRRLINVRVQGIRYEAEDIFTFELRPAEDTALPPFTAGAHIEILMQDGLERSYSLVNSQHETHRYVVAVARDPQSRGGSNSCAIRCDRSGTADYGAKQ